MRIVRISELPVIKRNQYIYQLRDFLKNLVLEYPLHNVWYDKMIISMYENFDREIVLAFEGEIIIGAAILKSTLQEKKICTLRVSKLYRRKGIGRQLLMQSLDILQIEKPIITIPSYRYLEYKPLFDYFSFNLEAVYNGKYYSNKNEYVYNGILLPESLINPNDLKDYQMNRKKISIVYS